MKLDIVGNKIVIEGNIKTVNDFDAIKEAIEKVLINSKDIILSMKDSIAITSAVIGYLYKLKNEGINISLEVGSDILYELLEDLSLINEFNVKKI